MNFSDPNFLDFLLKHLPNCSKDESGEYKQYYNPLSKMILQNPDDRIKTKATYCLAQLLKIVNFDTISFADTDISDVLKIGMNSKNSGLQDAALLLMAQLFSFSDCSDKNIVEKLGKIFNLVKKELFEILPKRTVVIKRAFLIRISKFFCVCVFKSFNYVVEKIIPFFNENDKRICEASKNIFDSITKILVRKPDTCKTLDQSVVIIAKELERCSSEESFVILVDSLAFLVNNYDLCTFMPDIRFDTIIKMMRDKEKHEKIVESFYSLCSSLEEKELVKKDGILAGIVSLVLNQFPVTEELLHVMNMFPPECFKALEQKMELLVSTFIVFVMKGKMLDEIAVFAMNNLDKKNGLVLFSALAYEMIDKDSEIKTKLFIFIKENEIPDPRKVNFPFSFETIDSLLQMFLDTTSFTSYDVCMKRPYKSISAILKQIKDIDLTNNTIKTSLTNLYWMLMETLSYVEIEKPVDPIPDRDPASLLHTKLTVKVKIYDDVKEFNVRADATFYELESLINIFVHGISDDLIESTYKGRQQSKDIWNIFSYPCILKNTYSTLDSILMKSLLCVPGIKHYSFKCGDYIFPKSFRIIRAILDIMDSPADLKKTVPVFEAVTSNQTVLPRGKLYENDLIFILSILNSISSIYPELNTCNAVFRCRMRNVIAESLSSVIFGTHYIPQLIRMFPKFFDPEFVLASIYSVSGLTYEAAELLACCLNYNIPVCNKCLVNAALREDLISVCATNEFRNSLFKLSFSYAGIKIANTEFFFNLSLAFFERNRSSMYIPLYEKNIIYPIYGKADLYLLGQIVAKAIIMGVTLSKYISPYVFYPLFGKQVKLEDVDPQLAQQLSSKQFIGKPFIIPGMDPQLQSSANQAVVTNENYDEYVEFVKSYICGHKWQESIQKFIYGINSIIKAAVLNRMNPADLSNILYSKVEIDGVRRRIDPNDLAKLSSGTVRKDAFDNFKAFVAGLNKEEEIKFLRNLVGSNTIQFAKLSTLRPKLKLECGSEYKISKADRKIVLPVNADKNGMSALLQ